MFTYLCRSSWFSIIAAISACSSLVSAWRAELFAIGPGRGTSATIFAELNKVRLETRDMPYVSPVVIVRYDLRLLYLLLPSMERYLDLPLAALGNNTGTFAYSEPKVDKDSLETTELQGFEALHCSARVHDGVGRTCEGSLWESIRMPGCPLMWRDSAGGSMATWRNAEERVSSAALFEIPDGFLRI